MMKIRSANENMFVTTKPKFCRKGQICYPFFLVLCEALLKPVTLSRMNCFNLHPKTVNHDRSISILWIWGWVLENAILQFPCFAIDYVLEQSSKLNKKSLWKALFIPIHLSSKWDILKCFVSWLKSVKENSAIVTRLHKHGQFNII